MLFCFCGVLVATNQRAALVKVSLLLNKDSSHSLMTGLYSRAACTQIFLYSENLIVGFVPTVCRSGRTDHLHRGSISGLSQEGLPTGDLYSHYVFHELSPGTRHGNESKFTNSHFTGASALSLLLLILFRIGKERQCSRISGRDNATDFPLACRLPHCYDQIWLPTTFATHILRV